MKKYFILIYLWIKSLFGTKVEGTESSSDRDSNSSTWIKTQKKQFWDIYNVDAEDRIDYTNTHKDHHSNFKHLDDPTDERFERVTEQKGLIYEKDGKTPYNAAEIYDMTYEQYEEYKAKILPIAKDRKITKEEIERFLEKTTYKVY